MSLPLPLPESRAHIAHIQSERKKNAFALAKTVPWYRDKLAGIDADALDDPAEWQKIPILDKDTLRKFSHAELLEAFCAVPGDQIAEYWRSGGSTGQPVFYPRTADDLRYGELSGAARSRASASAPAISATSPFRSACIRPARSGRAAPKCSAWGWFGSEPAIPIRQLHNSS